MTYIYGEYMLNQAVCTCNIYAIRVYYVIMGWGGNRKRREIEWIRNSQYEGLSKNDIELLKKFRSKLRYRNQNSDTIQKLKDEIVSRREKIGEYDEQLTYLFHELQPLINKYYFSVSLTSFKKGPNQIEYFNLIVNRPGRISKSIGMGNRDTCINHLKMYDPKNEDKINKDFRTYLKVLVNYGEVYDRIGKLITPLTPQKYSKFKLSRDIVFPLKKTK